jgi:hypothetical protein
MNRFIAYLLLGCFLFLNAPRATFHDCSKEELHTDKSLSFESPNDHCDFCSYNLEHFVASKVIAFQRPSSIQLLFNGINEKLIIDKSLDLFLNKAPPIL